MSIVSIVLASLVAVEFFYIFYLESIATKSNKTRKVFNINKDDQANETVVTLFKNQGIYNGLLGVLILIAVFYLHNIVVTGLLMGYIILVAVYGAVTSQPKILLMQGGLPILTLISLFFK
ncbi:DUF1304 domain-containing protein [Lactobacillus gigeriorum]|uniref:Integral membrane protein n=1 Tax=Lactobacillus gigeriorum DSM 23908 = CRBIP 24.85 TaxID=1423751 RepID=I7LD50_9LACO|nr:DUF1304 domain-containing protein [Lactobacillus gigeriorum]KRN10569.1 hypothetical protein FC38_GL000967 [Lactobacillus gigeriorum DSM 23908 = CRBIP 24.85]CCI87041.1 Integral membrane protein [Lactobacillus gigeriorum DSM 23908 = CRBIP 24.85]